MNKKVQRLGLLLVLLLFGCSSKITLPKDMSTHAQIITKGIEVLRNNRSHILISVSYLKARVNSEKMTWNKAYNYCSTLNIDNHKDWYMPSRTELMLVTERNLNIKDNSYWTYTMNPANTWEVKIVNIREHTFKNANIKSEMHKVICSRLSFNTTTQINEEYLQAIYFANDSYFIDNLIISNIDRIVKVMEYTPSKMLIKLEGNTNKFSDDEHSFSLGLKRVEAVKKMLIAKGVDKKRIRIVSYGASNPVCSENTNKCKSKNNRVDITLIP